MKKYIKNVVSFIMSIVLAVAVFSGALMSPENTISMNAAAITTANAKEVYRYLVCTMGLSPAAACGVMANIAAESGFRTDVYGDGGTSYGLCQWHDTKQNSGRMTALFNFCKTYGYDVTSVEGQMRYLESELKGPSYPATYEKLTTATNDLAGVYQAAYYWCLWFEVPADREVKAEQRAATAQNDYWPVYGTITGINVSTVDARCVTEESALLSGSIYKPVDTTIDSCGIYFGNSQDELTKYVNDKYTGATNVYGISFNFYTSNGGANPTLNVILEKGTQYYYQFYCVVGGVEYKGDLKSFRTAIKTKSIAFSQGEYDVTFDYEQWYENVYVNKKSWSMAPVTLDCTILPADTTDQQIWTSSNTSVATVADGKVYVKDEGVTTITVKSGDYTASCVVYAGRISEAELILQSKTQGTKQDKFVIGDTVKISAVHQSAVNCGLLTIYKVDGDTETSLGSKFFSLLSADGADWSWLESYEFTPTEVGTYKLNMMYANKAGQINSVIYFDVLDKSTEPIDQSGAEDNPSASSGLGSLSGVSLSLDGYLVLNYYVLPTDESAGSNMSMQFAVGDRIQTDKDYEIAVVGDKIAYKYECQLAAAELTENITAKLVLDDKVKEISTISAYDYCRNVLNGSNINTAYGKAAPVVKALMNYCGYAQTYFEKNTTKLANADLYSGVGDDIDPVVAESIDGLADDGSYFSVEVNGTVLTQSDIENGAASMNGIQYAGASLTLDSGTGLNMYFILSDDMDENDLTEYVFSVDDVAVQYNVVNGILCVPIVNISAQNLGKVYSTKIASPNNKELVVKYSPVKYMIDMQSSQSIEGANLMRAMYLYYKTAEDYKG